MGSGREPLTAAIARARVALERPPPDSLGVCTDCCMAPARAAALLATPARDWTAADLCDWQGAAFAPGDGHGRVAWLLPRMFELLAAGETVTAFGLPTALARLPATGFPNRWPAAEAEAVRETVLALFDAALTAPDCDLDAWFCMAAGGGLELAPFLDRVAALSDARLVALLSPILAAPRIALSPHWRDGPALAEVWAFCTAPALADRLFLAADTPGALDLAERVHAARDTAPPPA